MPDPDRRNEALDRLRGELRNLCHALLALPAADFVVGSARPAIRLRTVDRATSTHLGGSARLDGDAEWPSRNGKPLSLLAVIDLAELAPFVTDIQLAPSGLLNVFYETEEQVWGFTPTDLGAWRVVAADPSTAVVRKSPAEAPVFASVGLAASQTLTIPGVRESVLAPHVPVGQGFSKQDMAKLDAHEGVLDAWHEHLGIVEDQPGSHQVGGWPRLIQESIWHECDVVSQGFPQGSPEDDADSRVQALPDRQDEWQLLLQWDTDDEAGWMWGDVGTLYFAVRRASPLTEPWMVLQCS